MCAITGIISDNPAYHGVHFLEPILSAMLHRGPDATATVAFNQLGCFGHNRLSIVDLHTRSKQPMWDHTHRYCLVLNGEIYNYRSLKNELIQLGHQFRTESDTEVLIEAWLQWSVDAVQKLVGMFAFAIWDALTKKLYLVRDRMGEKPLFYAHIKNNINNGLIFASELKGLMKYPFINKELSFTALNHYLSFGYTTTKDCIFNEVYKLPPASYLLYNTVSKSFQVTQYWFLEKYFKDIKAIQFDDAKAQLNTLLKNAVHCQSMADVPLGAFLSGGIDSSSIVANMPRDVNTFCVGFQEKTYSEIENSRTVANYLSVKHHAKTISPVIFDKLPAIIKTFDEPFSDTSIIPTYLLCEFARQFVKVSLSGDGGDELFGGYSTYQADRLHRLMRYFPVTIKKTLMHVSHYLPTSFNKLSVDYKIKQFLKGSLLNAQKAHLSWREIFNLTQKKKLFKDNLQCDSITENLYWFDQVTDCHYLNQAMYVDMKTWLVDDILVKVDRASMAHSLEVRAPFLDHRIVEFAAGLPVSYKIKKSILKSSQKNNLPRFVLKQSKKGFNSPISHWLSRDILTMAHDITTSRHLTQWFDKKTIETLWSEHQNGVCDNGYRLFNLLCLGFWLQR